MEETTQPHSSITATVAFFEGGILILAVALAWLFEIPIADQLSVSGPDLIWTLAALVPPLLAVRWGERVRSGPISRLYRVTRETLVPLFAGCAMWELALIGAAAGVCEEALFRGVIQYGLAELFSPAVGLIAASALFGAAHWLTTTYAVAAFVMGLYLGGLMILTGGLAVPIAVHGLYDFFALAFLVRSAAAAPAEPV